ncbi:hypothetical protein FA10DRAFT_300653 [Acaromyces ingoldii]|uniref:GYF domain-containing protein n=1 Tax=Acaromyces ingoldii TaxID=215250 RepID=A0A316YVQ0_9BASI|nr:hypothetical protein FA10DRAFT_300653 [Acaromyces ingoldii]PWN92123.1 hypothetical protein FA10DRAFT_300653 [Acaromyces ingoldii]
MSSKRKASSSGGGAAPLNVNLGVASSEQLGQPGGAPSTAKRTRFEDAPQNDDDTDLAGDLDLQEQERKRTQQGRRGRVVTAGYDSEEDESGDESENEDEEGHEIARKSQREKGGKAKVAGIDEDDDMFDLENGSDEEEAGKGEAKLGKKRYLQLGEIEGQEFGEEKDEERDRDLELEIESDDDDEDENEDLNDEEGGTTGVKKQKKTKVGYDPEDMGGKLDSFNMKAEMAAGRFDEEGNYIANAKDPHADHDKWLTGNYSRKGIKAAKEAQAKREKQKREEEAQRDAKALDEDESKKRLVECMRRGESVIEALQRLGAASKKAKASSSKRSNGTTPSSNGKSKEPTEDTAKAELEEVTSLTSDLMARYGLVNIYDETYESLLRSVRRSGLVRETWDPAAAAESGTATGADDSAPAGKADEEQDSRQFEYRWSPAYLASTSQAPEPDIKTFGPFGVKDLHAWSESGFFGDKGERILLRLAGGDPRWLKWAEVFPM